MSYQSGCARGKGYMYAMVQVGWFSVTTHHVLWNAETMKAKIWRHEKMLQKNHATIVCGWWIHARNTSLLITLYMFCDLCILSSTSYQYGLEMRHEKILWYDCQVVVFWLLFLCNALPYMLEQDNGFVFQLYLGLIFEWTISCSTITPL